MNLLKSARRSTDSSATTTTSTTTTTTTASVANRPPRRLLRPRSRDSNDDNSIMVDASPQPSRPSHSHNRSSLFGFSFVKNRDRDRANSATSSTVREGGGAGKGGTSAAGNTDEFGLSRPGFTSPQQQQQQQSASSSSSSQPGTQMATGGSPEQPQPQPGPQPGLGSPTGDQQLHPQQQTSQSRPQPQPQQQQQGLSQQQPQKQLQLHPEIRSIVDLSAAHAHKIYFSGPLVKHIERLTDGKIVGKEEPWREVWVQLGGTTLSVWDMKEIEEASKRGAEVPPTYLNITDASIHVLGAVTMPGPDSAPVKYMNVITLTTAGLNLLLFSCPSPQALVAWTAALRLSAYEKSRLEELYTAHLLRMSLSENGIWKDPRSPLVHGRLEGWVKIRINGQTDWKRLWMCVQTGQTDAHLDGSVTRKNRMSTLFGRVSHEHGNSLTSIPSPDRPGTAGSSSGLFDPRLPHILFYTSNKQRDRKKALLTLVNVTQVFAVYPERPELISRSTLIKLEGFIGDEELAGEWRSREGWVLMMPEAEPGKLGSLEMLKWLVGLHDAFSLYGRPAGYTWNPRDPQSLMFAYPVGPHKDNLFLDRELAETVDPREDRGSVVRQRFKEVLIDRMYGQGEGSRLSMLFPTGSPTGNGSAAPVSAPPSLPPIQSVAERRSEESESSQHQEQQHQNGATGTFQLPPLSFDTGASASNITPARDLSLSPITERTDSQSLSRGSTQSQVQAQSHLSPSASVSMPARNAPRQSTIEEEDISVFGNRRVESPPSMTPAYNNAPNDYQQERSGTTSPPRPTQLAPRFSQDSGAEVAPTSLSLSASASGSRSGSASGGVGVTSPQGARSPPLSADSSISRYSQSSTGQHTNMSALSPEQAQMPGSAATLQQQSQAQTRGQSPLSPASERDVGPAPESSSFGTQQQQKYQFKSISPTTSMPPQPSMQQQLGDHERTPLTPVSHVSHATYMSSPFSINERNKDQPPVPPEKTTTQQQQQQQNQRWEPQYKYSARESEYVFDEPGALYLMHQQRQAEGQQQTQQHAGHSESEEDERSEASEHSALTNPLSIKTPGYHRSPPPRDTPSPASPNRVPVSPVSRHRAPGGFEVVSGAVGTAALATVGGSATSPRSGRSGSLPDTSSFASGGAGSVGSGVGVSGGLGAENGNGPRGLGRRPSGARAPNQRVGGKRFVPSDSPSSPPLELDEHNQMHSPPSTSPQPSQLRMQEPNKQKEASLADDETVDALAALSFLEQQDTPEQGPARNKPQEQQQTEQDKASAGVPSIPSPPTILEPEDRAPLPPSQQSAKKPYRSSFAPSKQAAERKARSAAHQAAQEEMMHKPGRPNGKQRIKPKQREGGWESSEDEEEEEEEEEEDDDVGTDDEEQPRAASASRGGSAAPAIAAPVGRNPMVQQQMRGLSPSNSTSDDYKDQQGGQQRPARTLPQIPQRGRSPAEPDRRYDTNGVRESSMGRPQSQFPHPQYPPQFQQPQPGAARQNIWSSVLDTKTDSGMPGIGPNNSSNNRDTFVQIEAPAETMTKAFTPQGLLSAGMQDKEGRSAKRQEELARESGASLINVPNKPPPPQVGLLGAITAHERERKREGGMGATITEREREKRMAEERQRRLDELQRQQLEQQQQFAAQFGGMGMYGGGLSPQMTGMNPMMGGFGGFPQMMGPQSMYFNPMMPMMNPQHMFAAQQAAQAYQQAMIAMSTAGSQVGAGGEGGAGGAHNANGAASATPSPAPMMGGGSMGFDPRMSMMSMGGLMPMMPMGGMPQMGMPMTGGSGMVSPGSGAGMDPRFSIIGASGNFDGPGGGLMGNSGGNTPGGGSGQHSQRASAYNGSPRGSPAPALQNRSGTGNTEN